MAHTQVTPVYHYNKLAKKKKNTPNETKSQNQKDFVCFRKNIKTCDS